MNYQINNCYEKIINNYLEATYLELMSIYDDNELVIKFIYRAFEKVFVVDYEYINILTIKDRIIDNINLQVKKSVPKLSNCKDCVIDKRIYLFNFNLASYFNELDNKIIILVLLNKIELTKVATLLNYKEEYILNRLLSIVNWMRVHFINVIKEYFTNENKNELELV